MRGKIDPPEFKLKLVKQVLSGEKRPAQLCREHNISEAILLKWRHAYAEKGDDAFQAANNELEILSRERQLEKRVAELERMIGQLAFENSILKTVLAHKTAPSGCSRCRRRTRSTADRNDLRHPNHAPECIDFLALRQHLTGLGRPRDVPLAAHQPSHGLPS